MERLQLNIESGSIRIIVKPNSPKNKIVSFDKNKGVYRVEIKAKPDAGKANVEIVKFFSRLTKKKVRIIKGFTSKEKVLKLE